MSTRKARWRERHLEGLTIKTAWIVCEDHGVTKSGRKRYRAHLDAYRIKFTNGASLEILCEMPTWGFVGPKESA